MVMTVNIMWFGAAIAGTIRPVTSMIVKLTQVRARERIIMAVLDGLREPPQASRTEEKT